MIRKIMILGIAALVSTFSLCVCFADDMIWVENEKYPGVLSLSGHNSIEEPRINLVFVGYGYEDCEKFMQLVNVLIDYDGVNYGFFSKEPYKSNRDKFNIWVLKDIVYEDEHEKFLVKQQRCLLFNKYLVSEMIEQHCPFKNRVGIVLCNYKSAIVSIIDVFREESRLDAVSLWMGLCMSDMNNSGFYGDLGVKVIFLHEMGHIFNLYDEYVNNPDKYIPDFYRNWEYVNCVIADNIEEARENAPWKEYMGMGEAPYIIDCYEGALYYGKGVYRPTFYSLMNFAPRDKDGRIISLSYKQMEALRYNLYCEDMILQLMNRFINDKVDSEEDIYVSSVIGKYNPSEEIFLEKIVLGSGAIGGYNIYKGKVVWSENRNGNFDIFLYDIESGVERQITYEDADQISPDIFEDSIVWSEEVGQYFQIILDNNGIKKQITDEPRDHFSPCIYDNYIAWEKKVDADIITSDYDIYIYEIDEARTTQIASDKFISRSPSIYKDKVVYLDNKLRNAGLPYYDIFLYDISKKEYLCVSKVEGSAEYSSFISYLSKPCIFDNRVVCAGPLSFDSEWQYRPKTCDTAGIFGNYDILIYDLTTKEEPKINYDKVCQVSPDIFEDKVVYASSKNGISEIYLYDIKEEKETKITSNSHAKYKPAIYGSSILWLEEGKINIYSISPVTTITHSGIDGNWHVGPVTVTLTATDKGGTGIDKTYYSTDGTKPTTVYTGPFTLSQDGVWTIKYYSVDKAGNVESVKTAVNPVKIDTIKPIGITIKINNDAQYALSTTVTLTLSASDIGSGVSQMQFSNDGSNWFVPEAYSETKAWTLPTVGDGDTNGDGSINSADSVLLLRYLDNKATLTSSEQRIRADVNGDGQLTTQDAQNILGLTVEESRDMLGLLPARISGEFKVYAKFKDISGNWSDVVSDTIILQISQTPWKSNENGQLFTNVSWVSYTMGYRFTPAKNGKIIKLGGYFKGAKTVYLWDSSKKLIASATVNSANNWSYTYITPVKVVAGKTYTVGVYLPGTSKTGSYRYNISAFPKTYGDIRINSSGFYKGNGCPTTTYTYVMYGQVDIGFEPD